VLEVDAIVAEKLYAGSRGRPAENVTLLDKIRILRIIYSLSINSLPIGNIRTLSGDGISPQGSDVTSY